MEKKIFLRALEPEDLDFLYEMENDESLWEVGSTNVPYSRQMLLDYIATASTMPTISCPTLIPGTARGTEPCLMCRSLVQIELSVTRTMASRGSCITGRGFSKRAKLPRSI